MGTVEIKQMLIQDGPSGEFIIFGLGTDSNVYVLSRDGVWNRFNEAKVAPVVP